MRRMNSGAPRADAGQRWPPLALAIGAFDSETSEFTPMGPVQWKGSARQQHCLRGTQDRGYGRAVRQYLLGRFLADQDHRLQPQDRRPDNLPGRRIARHHQRPLLIHLLTPLFARFQGECPDAAGRRAQQRAPEPAQARRRVIHRASRDCRSASYYLTPGSALFTTLRVRSARTERFRNRTEDEPCMTSATEPPLCTTGAWLPTMGGRGRFARRQPWRRCRHEFRS